MRQFGLIGRSLAHSFSETYFTEKFRREGIEDASYQLFPIDDIALFPSLLREQPLLGLNVTIPYKESVMPFLDAIDEEAEKIGAVNCIRISHRKTMGFNTDATGFRQSILPFLENHYERALILGRGGASKAVAHVLRQRGIDVWYASTSSSASHTLSYDQLEGETMKHFLLIINCTPLGTFPETEAKPPIPYEGITADHFLYDLIYNPAETAFLREGKQRGAQTMNGLRMLQIQAEESWKIWNCESILL
jgi:shikimate dehydrogenase